MRFLFDPSACSACGACAVACMDWNSTDPEAGMAPIRRVTETVRDGAVYCRSESCHHCSNAPCVRVCGTGALYRDTEFGLTLYDREKCIGCGSCVPACPFDALYLDPEGRVYKCDGCIERQRWGLAPACVKACPVGALTITE